MRAKVLLTVCWILAVAFLALSCAKPPTEEMGAARTAIEEARRAEADKYAPEKFKAAEDALTDAEAKVTAKDYDAAKLSAIDAKGKADEAKEAAIANKETVKAEAERLMGEVEAAVLDARKAMEEAPAVGKGVEADLELLSGGMAAVNSSFAEVQSAFRRGDYWDVPERARSVKSKASDIKAAIDAAVKKAEELREKLRPWYEL